MSFSWQGFVEAARFCCSVRTVDLRGIRKVQCGWGINGGGLVAGGGGGGGEIKFNVGEGVGIEKFKTILNKTF